MSKRNVVAVTAFVFALSAPMAVSAKNPHPDQLDPAPELTLCECDEFVEVALTDPTQWEGLCDVAWETASPGWPAYGASIEYEAEWMEGDLEMSAEFETEVDYECEGDDPQTCSADAVPVTILMDVDGDEEFELKVKGFDNGNTGGEPGQKNRDFSKESLNCEVL